MHIKILLPVLALGVLIGSGVLFLGRDSQDAADQVVSQTPMATIEAQAFMEKLASIPDAVLLDVRTPEEFADGHIEGAINLDFYQSDFAEQIASLDTSKEYFLYCRSGNRSSQAAQLLVAAGVKSVYELKGGLSAAPELLERKVLETVVVDIGTDEAESIQVEPLPGTLSQSEITGLLRMREEEKLAHDVYVTLYEKWGTQIFTNIAQSEQTHTEAVRSLLELYGISDPVVDSSVGVFVSAEMKDLYTTLTVEGSKSLTDALRVGALIEDMDIVDLQKLSEATDNANIKTVYANLMRGSRNHLRSFTAQLSALSATYAPEYLTEAAYTDIVTTERETGGGGGHRGGRP